MTTIAPAPFTMDNCTLKIDADNYEKAITRVEFVPTSIFESIDGSEVYAWDANLEYVQDWETAGSLSNYLAQNAGSKKAVEFVPLGADGGFKFTATLTLKPGSIGGAAGRQAPRSTVTVKSTAPQRVAIA